LLEEFKQEQDTYRQGCRQTYNDKVDSIVTTCLSMLVTNLTKLKDEREKEDLESSQRGQANKHKSMSSQRYEDEVRRRLLRLTKRNYRSLGTYIRLVDYMVLATQVEINQESAEKILFEIRASA
jgi:chromosomal replication initiation ATPase DnaA